MFCNVLIAYEEQCMSAVQPVICQSWKNSVDANV